MSSLLEWIRERPLVFDGATGSNLELLSLGPDDFEGHPGCNEVLVRSRPDKVQELHRRFLEAGCQVVETNTFGGSRLVLAEHGLAGEAHALNRRAAELAREVARDFSSATCPRWVAGSMGPGTRLPSLGQISFDELRLAYREQAAGLLEGGVDLLALETCQDLLQVRAALLGTREALRQSSRKVPLLVSLTLEAGGSLLGGADLSAVLAVLLPLEPDLVGLNCSLGPLEMKQHLRFLAAHCPLPICAQPNAGIPENVDGRAVYPLGAEDLAGWLASFVEEDGVEVVGGCCGTTPEHMAEVVRRLEHLRPAARRAAWPPSLASAYSAVSLAQEPRPLLVGERTNANGSKRFRELLLAERFDEVIELAREQERGGAHALDLCTAYAGRDEAADMAACVSRLARQSRLPLVIDSTQPEVMRRALELHPGRCLINSVNLESGEARALEVLELCRRYGAAVVALAIDEQGMAREAAHKLEVCERLLELAGRAGLPASALCFDLLTFTVASGDPELRPAARQTLEGLRALKARHPEVFTLLGVSNVSYGLRPPARRVLNSVFLHLAVQAGLDLAIAEAGKLLPLSRIDPEARALAEALLLDDRQSGDPLARYLRHFQGRAPAPRAALPAADLPLEERLRRKIIDGEPGELELLLGAALTRQPAAAILEQVLLPAMDEVGRLFGSGQMQLPFVLQSAETMRAAVSFLEPLLAAGPQASRGKLVLATVAGDVHDIGKNLVDIILSNNGFRVRNLGIRVSVEEMIRTWREEGADAIGMSGLLVKSTQVMKENLLELRRRGLSPTVLLGGAALSRRFVEEELRPLYGPNVHYCRDGFDALRILRGAEESPQEAGTPPSQPRRRPPETIRQRPEAGSPGPHGGRRPPVPEPPYLGVRALELPLHALLERLDEPRLFRTRWHYRRGALEESAYQRLLDDEVRPILRRWRRKVMAEGLLRPRALCGYFRCQAEGESLRLSDHQTGVELARFHFPRSPRPPHRCLADLFRTAAEGPDLLAAFVVTLGDEPARRLAELFAGHHYRELLHLHGLVAEAAECAADLLHGRVLAELGLAAFPGRPPRGRFSFGYPGCPDLEAQRPLLDLLGADRIGLGLNENAQLVPEHSLSALVLHQAEAAAFW